MSKAALDNAVRNSVLNFLNTVLMNEYQTDILEVSSSELAMPVVDAEGNEKWAVIKVTIPRGTRTAEGFEEYDGYAAHEDWELEQADRADKAKKREEKKARAEAEKERKRAAKQTIKTMKVDIQQVLPNATNQTVSKTEQPSKAGDENPLPDETDNTKAN